MQREREESDESLTDMLKNRWAAGGGLSFSFLASFFFNGLSRAHLPILTSRLEQAYGNEPDRVSLSSHFFIFMLIFPFFFLFFPIIPFSPFPFFSLK